MESYIIYNIIVFFSFIYILNKVGLNKLSFFIVLIFWEGLFGYLDSFIIGIHDAYKIIVVVYVFIIFRKNIFNTSNKHEYFINILFLFFSISFWFSYFINGGKLITLLSQYFFKYGFVFFVFHGFKELYYNDSKKHYVKMILLRVIYIQVFLSIVKILIFPFPQEHIVGSMSAGGAGLAVIFPIEALIFYWIIKNGNIKKIDWIIIIAFFLISVASGKRAPVILFPFCLFFINYFTKSTSIKILSIVKYIPLIILFFYVGVRLTPTLNPENKAWGSFSLNHVRDYVLRYQFGTADIKEIFSEEYKTYGRGGGIFLIGQSEELGLNSLKKKLFGHGLYKYIYEQGARLARGPFKFTSHRGDPGSINAITWALGYSGLFTMLLFALAYIYTIRVQPVRFLILFIFFYDFILYGNQVVFTNQSVIMVTFICYFVNSLKMKTNHKQISCTNTHRRGNAITKASVYPHL